MATATGAWGESYEVEEPVVATPETQTPETPAEVTAEVTPTVVTPETVETPAAVETPTNTEPPAETPTVAETIREVEKIVEKYPEMDEYTSEVFKALMDGKEDVLLNYLNEKNRDYKAMSDYDVVKTNLKRNNPNWSDEDVELKIEVQYGDLIKKDISDLDPDVDKEEYDKAVQFNAAVDKSQKLLRLEAVDARVALEAAKKEVKLPKIVQAETPAAEQPSAESLEQAKQAWIESVNAEIPTVKEFTFKVGDEATGYEDVSYKVTDQQRKQETEFFKDLNFDKLVKRLGWIDESGKQNVAKMAGDVLKLENVQKLISSAYTQGKTTGATGTVAEIKNIDLSNKNTTAVDSLPPDIGDVVWGRYRQK